MHSICLKFLYETLMKEKESCFREHCKGSSIIFPISIDEGDFYPNSVFQPALRNPDFRQSVPFHSLDRNREGSFCICIAQTIYPLSFFHLGPKDKFDFCMTLSDKEPYYGFTGALKCLRENQGDVGFFHTLDVRENLHTLSQEFQLVCRKKRKPLNWKNIINPNCHLAEEHPQVSPD